MERFTSNRHGRPSEEEEKSPSLKKSRWDEQPTGPIASQSSLKALKLLEEAIAAMSEYLRPYLRSEFLISHDVDWKGELLAYVAQMIRSNIEAGVPQPSYSNQLQVVVAAALILDQAAYKFVIGLNANNEFLSLGEEILKRVPKKIGGFEVLTVIEDLHQMDCLENALRAKFKSREKKEKPLPPDTTVWSWHAEQKVMTFIKAVFPGARQTVHALGIAHVLGPCTPDTAGKGTNYCGEYLHRKHVKCQRGGDPALNVAAYWYSPAPTPDICSIECLAKAAIVSEF